MLGTLLTPYIVPKWVEIRVLLITFLFLLGASIFLLGPFYEEKNLEVMLIGLALSGMAMGPLIIPNLVEMMRATYLKHPSCDKDHRDSLLSGMLNFFYGLGMSLGPLLGGLLYQVTDFRTMNDIIGTFIMSMAVLYFLCAGGYQAYRQTCINFSKRNRI